VFGTAIVSKSTSKKSPKAANTGDLLLSGLVTATKLPPLLYALPTGDIRLGS